MKPAELRQTLLARPRVAVCVGCGGVGKTTVAAALALEAARSGRRTLVLTIDPARRLADALGIDMRGNEPQALSREMLDRLGVPPGGALSALMLDMKSTFDELVARFAESEEARTRILENPIYRHASDALAGSVEYSAMEKVYEMSESGRYDLIVVDTPPAQHALDFLDAPQRLIEFLDSRLVQLLIHPAFAAGRVGYRIFRGGFGLRVLQQGSKRALQVMERILGVAFLEEISEFLLAFEGMSSGFRQRAERVRTLLLGPEAAFVLVTGPTGATVRQAIEFQERLEAFGAPLVGVLVNRIRLWPEAGPVLEPEAEIAPGDLAALGEALAAARPGLPAEPAARAALAAAKGYAALVRRDARSTQELRERVVGQGRYWGLVPELPGDVHDLAGLVRIGEAVFDERGGDAGPGA